MTTRREAFGLIVAGGMLMPDGEIWTPGRRVIFLPPPRTRLIDELSRFEGGVYWLRYRLIERAYGESDAEFVKRAYGEI
jgi:hypothetical protein